jgi:hypothetical protein
MSRHVGDDKLQDFREGLLPPEDQERIRAHLEECSQCRDELETLSRIMDGLGELPLEAQPPRDLWPQISWRMGGEAREEESPAGRKGRERRWVRMPVWQLLAAGIAIAVMSGGGVWLLVSGGSPALSPSGTSGPGFVHPAGWEQTLSGYDEAVADLEAVLEQGREVLDAETIRVLEENLNTIDQAIQEAAEALDRDPESGVLRRLLSNNLRRKVDLLRVAASAVYSTT